MAQTVAKVTGGGGGASAQARGLAVVRILLGVFFVCEALGKWRWFADSSILAGQIAGWSEHATPAARWYLDHVVTRGIWYYARLVPLGELAAGLALITGLYTRLAAALAFLMVLNFHLASSAIFQTAVFEGRSFLTNGYGLPVLSGLLGLAIGGKGLPWGLRK